MLSQNNYFPVESGGASIPYQEESEGNDKHSNINLVMVNTLSKFLIVLTHLAQIFYY